ncbi:MAG: zinc metallopeptidase [Acidobacteriota bacterium]|nr:zinc metallopeptidase [Acidobacteriota bacterium]
MYLDPLYFVFFIPPLLLSMWASWKTRSAFKKYSNVKTLTGLTGAQAAERLLRQASITDVKVVPTRGYLSDHYNPVNKTLALSEAVYASASVAAVGVACHEAGHAIQHATSYKPLWLRSLLVPTANIGSKVGYFAMMIGLMMAYGGSVLGTKIVILGAVFFSAVILFQLVTLPVEFDASARAKRLAVEYGIVLEQERVGVDRVLNAAALTYVAAAVASLAQLLYFLVRSGALGGRR